MIRNIELRKSRIGAHKGVHKREN